MSDSNYHISEAGAAAAYAIGGAVVSVHGLGHLDLGNGAQTAAILGLFLATALVARSAVRHALLAIQAMLSAKG